MTFTHSLSERLPGATEVVTFCQYSGARLLVVLFRTGNKPSRVNCVSVYTLVDIHDINQWAVGPCTTKTGKRQALGTA